MSEESIKLIKTKNELKKALLKFEECGKVLLVNEKKWSKDDGLKYVCIDRNGPTNLTGSHGECILKSIENIKFDSDGERDSIVRRIFIIVFQGLVHGRNGKLIEFLQERVEKYCHVMMDFLSFLSWYVKKRTEYSKNYPYLKNELSQLTPLLEKIRTKKTEIRNKSELTESHEKLTFNYSMISDDVLFCQLFSFLNVTTLLKFTSVNRSFKTQVWKYSLRNRRSRCRYLFFLLFRDPYFVSDELLSRLIQFRVIDYEYIFENTFSFLFQFNYKKSLSSLLKLEDVRMLPLHFCVPVKVVNWLNIKRNREIERVYPCVFYDQDENQFTPGLSQFCEKIYGYSRAWPGFTTFLSFMSSLYPGAKLACKDLRKLVHTLQSQKWDNSEEEYIYHLFQIHRFYLSHQPDENLFNFLLVWISLFTSKVIKGKPIKEVNSQMKYIVKFSDRYRSPEFLESFLLLDNVVKIRNEVDNYENEKKLEECNQPINSVVIQSILKETKYDPNFQDNALLKKAIKLGNPHIVLYLLGQSSFVDDDIILSVREIRNYVLEFLKTVPREKNLNVRDCGLTASYSTHIPYIGVLLERAKMGENVVNSLFWESLKCYQTKWKEGIQYYLIKHPYVRSLLNPCFLKIEDIIEEEQKRRLKSEKQSSKRKKEGLYETSYYGARKTFAEILKKLGLCVSISKDCGYSMRVRHV